MGCDQLPPFKAKEPRSLQLLLTKPSSAFLIVLALLGSNLLTYTVFCSTNHTHDEAAINLVQLVSHLLKELNYTDSHLRTTEQDLLDVKAELSAANREVSTVVRSALSQNTQLMNASTQELREMVAHALHEQNTSSEDPWLKWATWMTKNSHDPALDELGAASGLHPLPLGFHPGQKSDMMVSSIGHACALQEKDLKKFMDYTVRGECPDDQNLVQKLLLRGCEPLPRRRCFAVTPKNFTKPYPIPESYWKLPPNDNVVWSGYRCKSFECLNERKRLQVMDDCNDCFDLEGSEKERWDKRGSRLDFSIDEAVGDKKGSIRIGLDIGGGGGSFAVRMAERGVTIVTTTMNLNGPFNNFMALRGVVPLYITIAQRLPFFDNTLDIVHSMHVLSHWIPLETFEFLLFDIDRVLRPGGLFWLDRFFCKKAQFEEVYMPLIQSLGFHNKKWVTGRKVDRETEEILYLSAVLEKPLTRSF